jgi:hypothetical protein
MKKCIFWKRKNQDQDECMTQELVTYTDNSSQTNSATVVKVLKLKYI